MLEWLTAIRDAAARPPAPALDQEISGHAVLLSGATMLTHNALGGRTWCVVKFPFLIGRNSSRSNYAACDLYLADHEPYQVSRNHCKVSWVASLEGFYVQDVGSRLGTVVNGLRIGKAATQSMAPLRKGVNTILLGNEHSPFAFEVRLPKDLP